MKTRVTYLIPNQHSQLTSNHPSSLTYFHILNPIISSVGLCWSVNYIDLTLDKTRKRKCQLSQPSFPKKQLAIAITHLGKRGLTQPSHESRFQRIKCGQ